MSVRAKRFPANFPVVLRQGPDMFQATICNISSGGGCIVSTRSMIKGQTAVLDYAIGQTRATVMWSTGNMTGLRFDNQLSTLGLNSIRALKTMA
jgi:hypothetical protein